MGEAHRTSEARMRAAARDMVAALDRHGASLTQVEAVAVLGAVVGTFALTWGGEEEVVVKGFEAAREFVLRHRAAAP